MSTHVGASAGHRRALVLLCALGAAAAVVAVQVDAGQDALSWLVRVSAPLTVPVATVLLAVSVVHYVAAAGAARAAAGVALPLGEAVAAQLAASSANRVTPAGLGGAGVNGRYFVRRGGCTGVQAAAAVSALGLIGGLADVVAFAVLVAVGMLAGWPGAAAEVPMLVSRLVGFLPLHSSWWVLVGVIAAVGVVVVVVLARRHASATAGRLHRALGEFLGTVRRLAASPGRLAVLSTSSAATTLALAAGFAAAAVVSPGGRPASLFCALMIGYMAASAAGNALPIPGGIGTADAALVGVLVAAHESAAAAVALVLAFRVVTFWAPAVVGLGAARVLRRRGAL